MWDELFNFGLAAHSGGLRCSIKRWKPHGKQDWSSTTIKFRNCFPSSALLWCLFVVCRASSLLPTSFLPLHFVLYISVVDLHHIPLHDASASVFFFSLWYWIIFLCKPLSCWVLLFIVVLIEYKKIPSCCNETDIIWSIPASLHSRAQSRQHR